MVNIALLPARERFGWIEERRAAVGCWRTDVKICQYRWLIAQPGLAAATAEEFAGERLVDVDGFGGGGGGDGEGVERQCSRAEEESGAGDYEEPGKRGGLGGKLSAWAVVADGRFLVPPCPNGESKPAGEKRKARET
jgi:hypothetical protein